VFAEDDASYTHLALDGITIRVYIVALPGRRDDRRRREEEGVRGVDVATWQPATTGGLQGDRSATHHVGHC